MENKELNKGELLCLWTEDSVFFYDNLSQIDL